MTGPLWNCTIPEETTQVAESMLELRLNKVSKPEILRATESPAGRPPAPPFHCTPNPSRRIVTQRQVGLCRGCLPALSTSQQYE